MGLNEVGLIVS